jgi:alditol oxidase
MAFSNDVGFQAAATPSRANWAGNYLYNATEHMEPATVDEVVAVLGGGAPRVKALGSRHSFNHIADTNGLQIAPARLKGMSLDRERRTASVGAGVTYGELAPWLDAQGFAVHNLASLPHISVAGACATATHGSGLRNGCLSTAVTGLELLTGRGQRLVVSEETDPELFRAAVVGLGAFGVVLSTQLRVVPTFQIAQMIYEDLGFAVLRERLLEIYGAGYSVSVFTDWQEHRATQVWVKRKVEPSGKAEHLESFFGARAQTNKLHPLPGIAADACTEQLGVAGPWYERLPHFRLDYTPSAGAELQTEYFVPLGQAAEAIAAVEALCDRITPLLLISELRTVAADNLPLSMAYQRDSLAIHFTWKQELEAVQALLPEIESALEPYHARPHWAKLFTMPLGRIRAQYPEFRSVQALAQTHDPDGRFRNAFLEDLFGA